jgi:hypothetical protein
MKDVTAYVERFEKLASGYHYHVDCKKRNRYEYVDKDNVVLSIKSLVDESFDCKVLNLKDALVEIFQDVDMPPAYTLEEVDAFESATECKLPELLKIYLTNISRCVIAYIEHAGVEMSEMSRYKTLVDLTYRKFKPLSKADWEHIQTLNDEHDENDENDENSKCVWDYEDLVQEASLQVFNDCWIVVSGHGYGQIMKMSNESTYLCQVYNLWYILTSFYSKVATSESFKLWRHDDLKIYT